jgi:transposase
MAKMQKRYARQFRQQMVELVRAGRTPVDLSQEFGPTAQSIRLWVAQADRDAGKRDGLTTSEREELRRLRQENQQLKLEREILSKAAAWFAQETTTNSKRSSNS